MRVMEEERMLLSVIIPFYNSEEFLAECVESVVNEPVRDMEILLLDDGSTDNSAEVAYRMEGQYSAVKYHKLVHNGVSAARNAGLDWATGKYVFFLDADDRIEKGLLTALLEKMEVHNAVMGNSLLREFGCGHKLHCTKESEIPDVLEAGETIQEFLAGRNSLRAIGGKMMLRQKVGDSRFRTDLTVGEDTCFIYDFIKNGWAKTVFVKDLYYEYRMHNRNTIISVNAACFHSQMTVRQYLYDRECERVGATKAAAIWIQNADFLRAWMRRCCKQVKEMPELRGAILEQIKRMQEHPLYAQRGRRFRLEVFAFVHMFPVYKLFFFAENANESK